MGGPAGGRTGRKEAFCPDHAVCAACFSEKAVLPADQGDCVYADCDAVLQYCQQRFGVHGDVAEL